MEKNSMTLEIPCYMTDCNYRLRASSFMELAQVMAMDGSRSLGFGYDRLDKEHKAWILYRMQFRMLRPVFWRDVVTMKTWHRGLEGVSFLRDYELLGEDGERSAIGTSSWIVMDTEKRSFVRNADLPDFISVVPQCQESVLESPARKVVLPRGAELEQVCEHVVAYSDVDFIGHTNNVKYVVWAMDAVDPEISSTLPVYEVTVNFNSEARLGDKVRILRHKERSDDGLVYYVEGFVGDKLSFSVKLVFLVM